MNKTKELYKRFFKWFLIFSPLYILIILACTVKMNAVLYLPGNLTDVDSEISIEGYDNSLNGSVSSVYVMDVTKPTYMTYALASIFPFTSQTILSEESASTIDQKLDYAIGVFDSTQSFDNASLAAFSELGDKITFSYHELTYIYSAQKDIISNMAYTKVVGKAIKSVTGIDGEYPKMEDISKFLGTILKGETVSMVLEDSTSKTYDFTITKNSETGLFGITILKSFKVTEAPSVTVKNVYTLGPSGGAMQALYIYMVMSGEDILKGRNIAGTGTIGHQTLEDGTTIFNKIGAIGCVGQKLYSAYKDKATIFYCPESNYDECMTYYKKYGFTEDMIRVVKVSTLTDIIDDLRGTN